jgi:hypothetical protein
MHNHQSKVSRALPAYEAELVKRLPRLVASETFGHLYYMLWNYRTPGIGPTTVYDVATRFGAYLELRPERIYLHAGVNMGLKALHIDLRGFDETFPMDLLPAVLRNKPPDEVEDFLCTYRMAFDLLNNG